jgi:hypothetical protein
VVTGLAVLLEEVGTTLPLRILGVVITLTEVRYLPGGLELADLSDLPV